MFDVSRTRRNSVSSIPSMSFRAASVGPSASCATSRSVFAVHSASPALKEKKAARGTGKRLTSVRSLHIVDRAWLRLSRHPRRQGISLRKESRRQLEMNVREKTRERRAMMYEKENSPNDCSRRIGSAKREMKPDTLARLFQPGTNCSARSWPDAR